MTPRIRLKEDLPRWLRDWLVDRGYAEEVAKEEAPALGLRTHLPDEAEHVQGKRSGPRTEHPE